MGKLIIICYGCSPDRLHGRAKLQAPQGVFPAPLPGGRANSRRKLRWVM